MVSLMHIVKSATRKAGQNHTVYTKNQQLSKITTWITWWKPDV